MTTWNRRVSAVGYGLYRNGAGGIGVLAGGEGVAPDHAAAQESIRAEVADVELRRLAGQQIGHDLAGDRVPAEAAAVVAGADRQPRRELRLADHRQAVGRETHDPGPAAHDPDRLQAREECRQAGGDAGEDGRGDPLLVMTQALVLIEAPEPAAEDLAVRRLAAILLVEVGPEGVRQQLRQRLRD